MKKAPVDAGAFFLLLALERYLSIPSNANRKA